MAAILIPLAVAIAFAMYACCVASGRESRREEQNACRTCGKALNGCVYAFEGKCCALCPDWEPMPELKKDGD